MSSPLLLLLILLSCLSLHVSDARHLRLTKKENAKVQVYHFTKDVEDTKVFETSITSRLRPYTLEGCISKQKKVKNGERNDHDSRGGANKQKDSNPNSKLLFKKQERANGEPPSGNYNSMVSFFQKELRAVRNIKGEEIRNVRSLLGSVQHNSTEETVDVMENDAAEDIVVMDYAQPHRKPPIHNEKH
ncbi:uncharacterized protein LOC133854054 [Alnus glutinosa]|uniref:uncharacterized protein LOC133854054 n=1 Tax=Alnus glutinosa TaxID=3517 RepID=UPI002D76DB34|nr:uncharacterized protein LOC133854054 [Alnus glutinosa]